MFSVHAAGQNMSDIVDYIGFIGKLAWRAGEKDSNGNWKVIVN